MKILLMWPGDDYIYGNPAEWSLNTKLDWFLCGIGFTILTGAFLIDLINKPKK